MGRLETSVFRRAGSIDTTFTRCTYEFGTSSGKVKYTCGSVCVEGNLDRASACQWRS